MGQRKEWGRMLRGPEDRGGERGSARMALRKEGCRWGRVFSVFPPPTPSLWIEVGLPGSLCEVWR